MVYSKVVQQYAAYGAGHFPCLAKCLIGNYYVAGKGDAGRAYPPEVKVVNPDDAGNTLQAGLDLSDVDTGRCSIHQDLCRIPDYRPASPEDEYDDDYRKERVQPVPGPEYYDNTRYEDRNRKEKISHHVQEGAFHVHIVMGIAMEEPGGQAVSDDANQRSQGYNEPGHRLWMKKSVDSTVNYEDGGAGQNCYV